MLYHICMRVKMISVKLIRIKYTKYKKGKIMNIGNIKINAVAALAPMAGVTDKAFREICALCGAAYFTSEMISTKGLIYNSQKTFDLMQRSEYDNPFAIQLFGNTPSDFAKAIEIIQKNSLIPDIIDINMGCPATKIVKENSGSALMKNPQLCGEIVKSAKSVSPVPVTVKIRSGWNYKTINAVEIAKICEQSGADAITVHARTKEQGYSEKSNLEVIKKVKENVKIPVIGNGDIIDAASAKHMMNFTKCDMVAVGRGAMGNPWIFSEINASVLGKSNYSVPTIDEKIKLIKTHIQKICTYKGEQRGIKEARKHMASYIKDIPNAANFRKEAFSAESKDELFALCDKISKSENQTYVQEEKI